ncbi:MAG: single-stranded-DNA-specific exonuclease RecJ [Clostridiales bacterium]|nr:single-stranded-DNA-specific exonuclease RecJ [Clostridiales bacterium]
MMSKWLLRQSTCNIDMLSRETGIDPVIVHILAVHGYRNPEAIKSFLNAENLPFASANLFRDMGKAVDYLAKAICDQKLIAIFGDYDADGLTSTAILYLAIKKLGGNISYYIPERSKEGYGLNNEAIHLLHSRGVELILACDNGISCHQQVEYANSLGICLLILDHHSVPQKEGQDNIPFAHAVVNPHRQDCAYPFKYYCAGGLSYRFAEELFRHFNAPWQDIKPQLLALATIATICDLVELTGENRTLVKQGLPQITTCNNPGLSALLSATGLLEQEINTFHIGYIIGPCINACGRLGMADMAVDLFTTCDPAQAMLLASHLISLNNSRKEITNSGTMEAIKEVEDGGYQEDKVIVISSERIQESVAGIIAGKVRERYNRPTLVFGGGQDILHGSGRSIDVYNMALALSLCEDIIIQYGGHPMAVGLTIQRNNIGLLRKRLNETCQMTWEDMIPCYRIDKQLPLHQANLRLALQLKIFEPFGKGNYPPYFADKDVHLLKIRLMGQNQQTMRLTCRSRGGGAMAIISFEHRLQLEQALEQNYGLGTWQRLLDGREEKVVWDLIYTIEVNEYNGSKSLQLKLVDFRFPEK